MSGEWSLFSEVCLYVNDLILMLIVKYESVIKGFWDEKNIFSFWILLYL